MNNDDQIDKIVDELTGDDSGVATVVEREKSDFEEAVTNPSVFRSVAIKFMDYADRRDEFITAYSGSLHLAYEATLLALGKVDLLGDVKPYGKKWNTVTLGKKHGVSKADVTKIIKTFQARVEIPPMMGQRSLAGCRAMQKSRNGQLKTK